MPHSGYVISAGSVKEVCFLVALSYSGFEVNVRLFDPRSIDKSVSVALSKELFSVKRPNKL